MMTEKWLTRLEEENDDGERIQNSAVATLIHEVRRGRALRKAAKEVAEILEDGDLKAGLSILTEALKA
jgi:hypothetical protein